MELNDMTFAVIGGDARMIYAARHLRDKGLNVFRSALELSDLRFGLPDLELRAASDCDVLLFGLPFSKDGKTIYTPFHAASTDAAELISDKKRVVLCGNIPCNLIPVYFSPNDTVIDYYTDEPFTLYNALLTAEGLVMLLMQKLPCALFGAEITILGFGRIGSCLTRLLLAYNARVTVCARSAAQTAAARQLGAKTIPLNEFPDKATKPRAIINTVPSQVCGFDQLQSLPADCILLEAASAPYGIDGSAADALRFDYTLASGLPARYAPESAGAAIAETALRIIKGVNKNAFR